MGIAALSHDPDYGGKAATFFNNLYRHFQANILSYSLIRSKKLTPPSSLATA
jgi:hypothetical protein